MNSIINKMELLQSQAPVKTNNEDLQLLGHLVLELGHQIL